MKKILITGANSYIGTSFERYMQQYVNEYQVDTIDMIDGSWREKSFSGYDIVYHVAGIAHQKETKKNADLYYKINKDLAIEVAKKAKVDGVSQFIFLSSMSVYGKDTGVITETTRPAPKSNYGKSKLQAEKGLEELLSDNFIVAILRPPMVYGEGCKGNYQTLIKIAKKAPFFADYKNERSMIHIDNLSGFIKAIIDDKKSGVYLPQDPQYVCTCRMIQDIAASNGKTLSLTKVLNPVIWLIKVFTRKGKKAFGNLTYVKELGE